jgi:light-regulated signal transduction histidine kinase (bacteriophytochrome)
VEHLQRVRAAAQRMGLLIDHLLALSRAARGDLVRKPVAVSAIAVSVLADLRRQAPERNVETLVEPGLTAHADETMARAVLTNLLGNAWKFTSAHGSARIEVGVTDADGERAFYVKDDGAGFDMGRAEHLFGAFQRLHAAEEFEGDGIGLATVQRLVHRHGGRVWAEAEPEKGATFFFTLPGEAAQG